MVRALNSEGAVSRTPATVSFRILPPFWRRWWFVTAILLLCSVPLLSFLYYRDVRRREQRRAREERFRELERVRQRIATDLHDDIGSSLTQISIMSEVAQNRAGGDNVPALSTIANSSRELIDAMSDIVWAINPQKDHLSDLNQRMRRFAADVLTARNVELDFRAPLQDKDVELGANIRREVFLIFKETVNNMVKHSGLTRAEIEFRIS